MRLPRGRLVRSRVVADPATPLADELERELTGYAVLEPQEAILLEGDGHGVLTFQAGVPVVAYHAGTDRGGPGALADLAQPGPYAADLYRLSPGDLDRVHEAEDLRVGPGTPAERLGGDPELAVRTRQAAPPDRTGGAGPDPVVSFLEDEQKLAAIREQAREQARQRATEWGLDDALE